MTLLADCSMVPREVLPDLLPPLPSHTPVPTVRQACEALPEPLTTISVVPVLDAYRQLGVLPAREFKVRKQVHERLAIAARLLPSGLGLVVLDAARSLHEQEALLAHYEGLGPTEGFVASVSPDAMRPPHTTGGAVDVTLSWNGVPLALGTDYDAFDDSAHLRAYEASDSIVRDLRRLLAHVLGTAGFVPYELEWWHWSYGDDVWAAATGQPALYEILGDES